MYSPNKIRNSILLAAAAIIWGFAFVAQSTGGDAVGPYAFNSIRNYIAVIALIPVILVRDKIGASAPSKTPAERRTLLITGITCGIALCVASTIQQVGITMGTPSGKAGFLTATYIVIIPIAGIFMKKHCGWNVWIGAFFMLIGIYLLCIEGEFTITPSDRLIILCAFCFAVQIMLIDMTVKSQDPVRVSQIEFLTTAILATPLAFFFDMGHSLSGIKTWALCLTRADAWISILFAGILSSAVAYTFQMVGQQGINPTIASMLMSMESMFAVIGGWLILGEYLSLREICGCIIMFAAIILAQLPLSKAGSKTSEPEPVR